MSMTVVRTFDSNAFIRERRIPRSKTKYLLSLYRSIDRFDFGKVEAGQHGAGTNGVTRVHPTASRNGTLSVGIPPSFEAFRPHDIHTCRFLTKQVRTTWCRACSCSWATAKRTSRCWRVWTSWTSRSKTSFTPYKNSYKSTWCSTWVLALSGYTYFWS